MVSKIEGVLTTERTKERPRVGVPWRTAAEESANKRGAYDHYLNAIREAGGEPVEVSLRLPEDKLQQLGSIHWTQWC